MANPLLRVRTTEVEFPVSSPIGLARRLARMYAPVMIMDGVPIDEPPGRGCLGGAGAALRLTARGCQVLTTWGDGRTEVKHDADPLSSLVSLSTSFGTSPDGSRFWACALGIRRLGMPSGE